MSSFPTDTCGLGKGSRCVETDTPSVLRGLLVCPTAWPPVSVKLCADPVTIFLDLAPDQGRNPGPLCWEHGGSATAPLGNSLFSLFYVSYTWKRSESTKMVFLFPKNLDVSSLVFLVIILVVLKPDWGGKINHLRDLKNMQSWGEGLWRLWVTAGVQKSLWIVLLLLSC